MRPRLVAAALALSGAFSLPVTRAAAQTQPSLDTRTWTPSPDHRAGLVTEPTTSPGAWDWNVGAVLAYAHHPVTLRRGDDVVLRPVEAALHAHLVGSLGLGARAAIGLDLPFAVYQTGSNVPPTVSSSGTVPSTAFGDLVLRGKGTIVDNTDGGFGLAVLGDAFLPTGDRTSFAGDGSLRARLRMLAEYNLLIVTAQASAGYLLRTDRRVWPEASAGGARFGDEIPYSVGFTFRPGIFKIDSANRQTWELGLHGWLPAGPVAPLGLGDDGAARLSPVLLAASDRIALGHHRDTYLLAGGEVGLNSAVGVPAFRVVASVGWAPRDHDLDHDAVADDVDQCPEIPEDKDGFEDADGCPEIDDDEDGFIDTEDRCPRMAGVAPNGCPGATPAVAAPADKDGDGIVDASDRCPDQPEDKDGFEDEDGCPDPDDDADGVTDSADACPRVAGETSSVPGQNGCPNVDRDGDTFLNEQDQCPDVPEVFNGFRDDDGCPDEGGRPLLTVEGKEPKIALRFATQLRTTSQPVEPGRQGPPVFLVDAKSEWTLRALALELHRHPGWTVGIGARPAKQPGPEWAQASADAVLRKLNELARRDTRGEVVDWEIVRKQPGADAAGVGIVVRVVEEPAKPPAKPEPTRPEPAKPEPLRP